MLAIKYSIVILTLLSGCVSKSGRVEEKTSSSPNIILLMGDDHGWEETSYNGHQFIKTPVLDEMASNGLRFDRFYAAAPYCTPTRASIITGRHPNRCGAFYPNWSIRPEEISIAQLLKNKGYATAHFGKWHLGPVKKESPTSPGAMGFDTWLSHDNFFEMNPILSRNGESPMKISGESSKILIDETISFITKRKEDKAHPFFVTVWFGSPHEPYEALAEDLALYNHLPDSLKEKPVSLTSLETGQKVKRPLWDVLRERYAEITAMDRAIGKLRVYLEENGLKDNTLIWYCGDNGTPESGLYLTPLREKKGSLYEGGVRVPGIVEWPAKIQHPRTTNMTAVTSDIFTTLCEVASQQLPNRPVDGMSLIKLMEGDITKRNSPICFWNYKANNESKLHPEPYISINLQEGTTPLVKKSSEGKYTRSFQNFHHLKIQQSDFEGERAIIDDQYKLIINGERPSEKQLYDINNDIGEQNNLIDDFPNIAIQLEEQLLNWQKSVLKSLTEKDYVRYDNN